MKFGCFFPYLRRNNRRAERQSAWPEIALFDEEKKEFLKAYATYRQLVEDISADIHLAPIFFRCHRAANEAIYEGYFRVMCYADMRRCRVTLSDIVSELEWEKEQASVSAIRIIR